MVKAACDAIATMAYVIPDVVLPLVYERFQVPFHPHINTRMSKLLMHCSCAHAFGWDTTIQCPPLEDYLKQ